MYPVGESAKLSKIGVFSVKVAKSKVFNPHDYNLDTGDKSIVLYIRLSSESGFTLKKCVLTSVLLYKVGSNSYQNE